MTKEKDPLWNEAHNELKGYMQKEIGIMREILANMHQEELSLLLSDKTTWTNVMQERSNLIERLSTLRAARMEATKKIETLAQKNEKHLQPTLEQILPTEDENSCEIFSLRDQIMALTERMNFQNTRNENLFHEIGSKLDFQPPPTRIPVATPSPQRAKRKAAIATYPLKNNNERR